MKKTRTNYSQSFKQQVLDDFFHSNTSEHECERKWNIPQGTLNLWTRSCKNSENSVSLHHLL